MTWRARNKAISEEIEKFLCRLYNLERRPYNDTYDSKDLIFKKTIEIKAAKIYVSDPSRTNNKRCGRFFFYQQNHVKLGGEINPYYLFCVYNDVNGYIEIYGIKEVSWDYVDRLVKPQFNGKGYTQLSISRIFDVGKLKPVLKIEGELIECRA